MARSGIACSDIALSITGVAGPQPGEDGNPSGLVHLAAACRDGRVSHVERFAGMLNPHTDFYFSAIRNRSINCELTMPAREHPKARSSRCETF